MPYKGTGPALNDIIASHVDLFFTELSTSAALHKAGKARILAVATKQRVAAVPDIPTLAEAGVAGCESDTWNAITAPPKTPAAIVAKLNDAANKALKAPTLLDRYKKLEPRRAAARPPKWRPSSSKRRSAGARSSKLPALSPNSLSNVAGSLRRGRPGMTI